MGQLAPQEHFYDRHSGRVRESTGGHEGGGYFTWMDVVGAALPVWLVLLALAIGTPLVAVTHDSHAAGLYAAEVAVYAGILTAMMIAPYVLIYALWRFVTRFLGARLVSLAAVWGLAVALAAIAVRGDATFMTAMLLYVCIVGVVSCTAQWITSFGRKQPRFDWA